MNSSVLFVSPRTENADLLSRMLRSLPVAFESVPNLKRARAKLDQTPYRVVLTEAILPDGSWHDALSLAKGIWPAPEVIVTDLHADDRLWAEVLNLGGYDMLAQPFHETEVRRIVSNLCCREGRTLNAGCAPQ